MLLKIFLKKKIILKHFQIKNTLKNNYYYNIKQAIKDKNIIYLYIC